MQTDIDRAVREVLAGDMEAFGRIVDACSMDVWRLAAAILCDRETTKDIVQRVFLRAFDRLGDYGPGTDFRAWLKTIARNEVRQELRARSRERGHLAVYRSRLEARLAARTDVEAASDRSRALRSCLEKLPARHTEIVRMRYGEALELKDIGRRLGRSADAVRMALARIRVALRDCLRASGV